VSFKTRYDLYRAVFALLPDSIRGQAFIGGGAAVDPDAARDIDLWILTDALGVEQDIADLRRFVAENGIRVQPVEGIAYGQIVPDMAVIKFGAIAEGFPKPVQIMFVFGDNYNTPVDVLGSFDISVHQVAVVERKVSDDFILLDFVRGPEATYRGEAVIITQTRTPEWTLLRYARLTHRYDQNMSYWQVAKLGLTVEQLLKLDDRLWTEEGIRIPAHIIANVSVAEDDRKNRSAA
jgi:hypothetical protein